MSEKRFKGYAEKTGQHYMLIINDELGEEYCLTDDFFKSKDIIFEIVDLLNVMNDTLLKQAEQNHKLSNKNIEQQAIITGLEQEIDLISNTKLFSRRELERKVDEQQATMTELKKDLKTVIDSYDCERIGYCHKGEYCKKWSLNNDR